VTEGGKSMGEIRNIQGRMFFGLIIIAIGLIFLLGSMDKLDVGKVFSNYWPLILVIIGLWHLISSNFQNAFIGILFIAVGGFFQLVEWGVLGGNVWNILWPLLIIVVGLWIIFKPSFSSFQGKVPAIKDDDLGSAFVLFSGIKKRLESKNFKGGNATALFGGMDLDFKNAELEGGQATVELTALFGGIDVWVPREWKVVVDSTAILGGVDDKHDPLAGDEAKNTLFIKATAIFGGIDIKN
jgi:predicted membrane protein